MFISQAYPFVNSFFIPPLSLLTTQRPSRINILNRYVYEVLLTSTQSAVIKAVCTSEKKGQQKHPVAVVHLRPDAESTGTPTPGTGTGRSVCSAGRA